jgi:4-carboxymuconolactone decarboxylase
MMSLILGTMNAQSTDEALTTTQKSLVAISAFTANGDQEKLAAELNAGLDARLTINDIKEAMVQLYAYAGFPRSLNALSTFNNVLKERKQKGINDAVGKEPSPLPVKDKLDFGTKNQTKLVGSPVKGEIYQFAPAIDQFLKEHLFGDIFGRDNLDFKTREIITISALSAMSGVENQLRSHMNVGMHNGLTKSQVAEITSIVESKVAPLFPRGQRITNDNFTGNAWLAPMVTSDDNYNTSVGNVTFEPGARTKWHKHPAGQILLATGGTGFYQEKGSAKRILRKGDVVKCPPDVEHWHGASPGEQFIQVAITPTDKGAPVWLNAVTDEEYNK